MNNSFLIAFYEYFDADTSVRKREAEAQPPFHFLMTQKEEIAVDLRHSGSPERQFAYRFFSNWVAWVPCKNTMQGKTLLVDTNASGEAMPSQDGHFVNVHRSHQAVKPKLRTGFSMQKCGGVQMEQASDASPEVRIDFFHL